MSQCGRQILSEKGAAFLGSGWKAEHMKASLNFIGEYISSSVIQQSKCVHGTAGHPGLKTKYLATKILRLNVPIVLV